MTVLFQSLNHHSVVDVVGTSEARVGEELTKSLLEQGVSVN
jgi:hypothetical protein